MSQSEQYKAGIYGLFVGDALGVPVEFTSRTNLEKEPVTGMRSGGTHGQPAGTWSDDSSMALCLMASVLDRDGINYDDIMRRFSAWMFDGTYTPYGECFDCGHACVQAISRYQHGTPAELCGGNSLRSNGNGSLMRILPLISYLYPLYGSDLTTSDEAMALVHIISGLTHRHPIAQSACGIYLNIAARLLDGACLPDAISAGTTAALDWYAKQPQFAEHLSVWDRIADPSAWAVAPVEQVNSGGYVVDSLEAALWCLLNTENYRDCVLKAVNLGEDTDTTAAIAGGLAGLAYGMDGIPAEWVSTLARKDMIDKYLPKTAADV
ncbi:MAG: ADP-ribosylglycohydrolase family protein [Clostridiales bacterium]|nr:ADP-ribosylglycohydrolase family protein [Clostridiales bacterium]